MAGKKDFSQDANSIFPVDVTKKPEAPVTAPPSKDKIKEHPAQELTNGGSSLIRRTYYITEDIYRALKIKAASSNIPEEKDQSAIVRAALKQYLGL